MSFEVRETSRYHGEPVDLFLFRYGAGANDYYAYCDTDEPITYGGITFEPHPIARNAINSSGTLDKSGLTVTADVTSEAADLFRIYPPTRPVTLIIYQGHVGDAEFLVIWTGRVLSCKFEDSEATFTCEPVATSMKRIGLRRHYQYGCPHALYMGTADGGCRASKAAATRTVNIVGLTATKIMLPSDWNGAFGKLKFRGGLVEWTVGGNTETRTILRVDETNNILTLSGPTRNLVTGSSVKVILGCNHDMIDCEELHNNILDYGGQPWIPKKSPFGRINNYW